MVQTRAQFEVMQVMELFKSQFWTLFNYIKLFLLGYNLLTNYNK